VIWQLCNGEQTTEEIISMIQAAYPGDKEGLQRDILDTLNSLADNDAVSVI
jgi:hypothetical protein